ncbi:hypothetical protein CERSUDRAFT_123782 [Gelatoporia subvermispora B]|uniref:AAA+ ATPase domain-containing protein n=1 Tax=Ceriporiopsis subvermispora (strain B) TaxID=914234 RepID=M2PK86_CERS8|nr:hypothetical protein CERSUDRAFT_123782 [Gelatoporia subvermispora B]
MSNFEPLGDNEMTHLLARMAMGLEEYFTFKSENEFRAALEMLSPANASFTSALNEEKSCLQIGTRRAILQDLAKWAAQCESEKRVYVLYGEAGLGKSSISHAFCRQLPEGHLGASFFFLSTPEECSDAYRVIPTIAYQLAESIPSLRPQIANATRRLQAEGDQSPEQQLRALILDPLGNLMKAVMPSTVVFVLDDVDRCVNAPATIVPSVLQLLCEAAHEIPFLRILIVTRPETYILDALRSSQHSHVVHWRDLRKDGDTDNDIRLFIEKRLGKSTAAGGFQLLTQRPNAITMLTQLSDGLFMWAMTATCLLLQNGCDAVRIFDTVLASPKARALPRAYERLDEFYMTILKRSFDPFREHTKQMDQVRQVLAWLVTPKFGFLKDDKVPTDLLSIVAVPPSLVMEVINRLRSVLIVDGDVTKTTQVMIYHPSLTQFLTDPSRCTDRALCVDSPSGHALIGRSMLDLLVHDIGNLRDARRGMVLMWQYSIGHWYKHVLEAQHTGELEESLQSFIKTRLSDWLRGSGKWASGHSPPEVVDACVRVRDWCKQNCLDTTLYKVIDEMIDRHVQELIAEVRRSPGHFNEYSHERIQAWARDGYTSEEHSVPDCRRDVH